MRVISSFVLAGWLFGGVAALCLVWDGCASPVRHECCCGHADDCCCRLTVTSSPASWSHIAALPTAPDLMNLPGAAAPAFLPGIRAASEGAAALAADSGRVPALPLYVSSHAFRC